jgi:hypothetical protein
MFGTPIQIQGQRSLDLMLISSLDDQTKGKSAIFLNKFSARTQSAILFLDRLANYVPFWRDFNGCNSICQLMHWCDACFKMKTQMEMNDIFGDRKKGIGPHRKYSQFLKKLPGWICHFTPPIFISRRNVHLTPDRESDKCNHRISRRED